MHGQGKGHASTAGPSISSPVAGMRVEVNTDGSSGRFNASLEVGLGQGANVSAAHLAEHIAAALDREVGQCGRDGRTKSNEEYA